MEITNHEIYKLNAHNIQDVLNSNHQMCISLYMPTHRKHPENQQDKIRYFGMIKSLEKQLDKKLENQQVAQVLDPLYKLIDDSDFWNSTLDGIAVFANPDFFRVFNAPVTLDELLINSDSFHIKPLLQFMQTADSFQVLALNLKSVRLYLGNQHELHELQLADDFVTSIDEVMDKDSDHKNLIVASYGGVGSDSSPMHHGHGGKKEKLDANIEKFFREVDKSILNYNSGNRKLPLILASLPEHHSLFQKVSNNTLLESEAISCNPEALDLDELKQKAWTLLKPKYEAKLSETIEEYTNAKANNQGSDDLQQILEASLDGQVDQLLIEAHKIIFGQINASNRSLILKEGSDSGVDDLLDDLAQLVLKMGGQVLVLPKEKMPTTQGLAGIFRYKMQPTNPKTKNLNLQSVQTKKASDKQIELDKARAASEGMV